jgi:hypothetical protein
LIDLVTKNLDCPLIPCHLVVMWSEAASGAVPKMIRAAPDTQVRSAIEAAIPISRALDDLLAIKALDRRA